MKIDFVPVSEALVPACRAFNQRLQRHGAAPFLLPEEIPSKPCNTESEIVWTHYVAVDQAGEVHGGVLLMEQRGWLGGQEIPLLNVQSPLTEGTVDRTFSGVGLCMLSFLARRNRYAYAVGMGSEENPFARLLKAAGWSVTGVPFQFAPVHATRVLTQIASLRNRGVARLAARTRIGAVAAGTWHLAHRRALPGGYAFHEAASWPNELDAVWARCRDNISFSIARDSSAVRALYPPSQGRLHRFLQRKGGELVGWAAALLSAMQGHPHFGNLRVGTILDALAPPEHLDTLLRSTHNALCDLGADLVLANCSHSQWQKHFRHVGFLNGPSNYLLAMSGPLSSALRQEPATKGIYVTRGDGDGRIHL